MYQIMREKKPEGTCKVLGCILFLVYNVGLYPSMQLFFNPKHRWLSLPMWRHSMHREPLTLQAATSEVCSGGEKARGVGITFIGSSSIIVHAHNICLFASAYT